MIADAAALRAAFDAAFAEPPRLAGAPPRRYLLATLAGRRVALRLDELLAVLPLPPLAAVPRAHPALLGVGAVRGRATAIFSLAALAGSPPEPGRWLALVDAALAVALAELDGVAEAGRELASRGQAAFISQAIELDGALIEVIDARALATTLKPAQREGQDGP